MLIDQERFCCFVKNTCSVTLRRFLSLDRQKSGFNGKKHWILIDPLDPHQKISNFLVIIAKLRSSPPFFMWKVISNVFGLSSMAL